VIGPITVKRTLKWTAGRTAAASTWVVRAEGGPRACILTYHRVASLPVVDPSRDDWNVPPSRLERQLAGLASAVEFVPLSVLSDRLGESVAGRDRPLVALTFDDGFANVVGQALPLLRRYEAPATLFVVTSAVGSDGPMPFDRWAQANHHAVGRDAWRAVTWDELDTWVDAGMELGAHSHLHLNGRDCSPDQLADEAHTSRGILTDRFGAAAGRVYAYPYGSTRLGQVGPAYREAVEHAGFDLAVTTDLGLAAQGGDPYALPRLEAHPLDSPAVLRAKARGALWPYALLDRLRRADRG
jgi:peptidoglycan/xylan/chitin deacetylase (PgdA/CDA1 family)